MCASVNVASTKAGIDMDAVALCGRAVKFSAERTADRGGLACAKLVIFSNAVEDNPFMAGAFHGPGEGDCVINVGVSGPGVVKRALERVKGQSFDVVAETIKRTAFQITRMGQLVAQEASQAPGRAVWHSRPVAGAHAVGGRLGRAHTRGDGPGALRHPWHDRCAGAAQ